MRKPRGASWIVLAGVMLVLGTGMAFESRANIPSSAFSPSAPPAPSSLAQGLDWKRYAVAGEALSFSYPADYRLSKSEPGVPEVSIILSDPSMASSRITIEEYADPAGLSAEDWTKATASSNFSSSNGILLPTTVGGANGVAYRWSASGRQADEIVVQYGDRIYAFTAMYAALNAPIRTDFGRIVNTAAFR